MSKIAAQVLPPLLLLPLFVMPVEVFTSLYWMAGFVAALLSVVTLSRLSAKPKAGAPAKDRSRALRPALTLVIFAAAAFVGFRQGAGDSAAADAFARDAAREVRAACVRDGKCPEAPSGWDRKPGERVIRTVAGRRVEYRRLDEGAFLITVRHPLEEMLEIRGGVQAEVEEKRVIR